MLLDIKKAEHGDSDFIFERIIISAMCFLQTTMSIVLVYFQMLHLIIDFK